MPDGATPFSIEDVAAENGHMLRLTGELDLASVPQLTAAVARVCADAQMESIVLDLRKLSFIDSSGMRGIVLASLSCDEHEIGLRILPGAFIRKRLELMGLAGRLILEDTD